jgi:ATP-dependent HslUV protease subunit HslV
MKMDALRGTTVLAVSKDGLTVMAGDGQVSMDKLVLKHQARKVRTLLEGKVLAGFAGSTADALTLFEKFEAKLKEYSGGLLRSAVELAKDWRTDRVLRRLEALLLVADGEKILLISGTGDVIEPDGGVMAIGSGGPYALAAAKALMQHSDLAADRIAEQAMQIAAELCVFTNSELVVEKLSQDR